MKVTTGRGIQFFKHPVFTVPKSYAIKAFNESKKNITNFINVGKNFGKKKGEK